MSENGWCCEYCGLCFATCGELAVHIAVNHMGQAFPNCCNGDIDCETLFGPGYQCVGGVCVEAGATYPMVIAAEAVLEGSPAVDIQIGFTINGVSKSTLYAESLEAGRYNFVFPATITYGGETYTLLGNNAFYIDHPANGETYFKASYFSYLPPTDTLIETYRGIDIWRDIESLNLYFRYEGLRYEFSSNTPIETVRARIDELLDEPPPNGEEPPPPPDEWPVSIAKHVFDNYILKAQAWEFPEKKEMRPLVDVDMNVFLGARMDYTITYVQGNDVFLPHGGIAVNGVRLVDEALDIGQSKSGSIDISANIIASNEIVIGFGTMVGTWAQFKFDVWITLGFSEEPATDPTVKEPPPWEGWEWYHWVALGGGALLLVYLVAGRKPSVIVVKG